MAGTRFLDAYTCPWTQGLHTSSLFNTRGIQIGVVLLLDGLLSPVYPRICGCSEGAIFPFPSLARGGPKLEANVSRLNPSATGPHDNS